MIALNIECSDGWKTFGTMPETKQVFYKYIIFIIDLQQNFSLVITFQ
jgi:hypothetical protein